MRIGHILFIGLAVCAGCGQERSQPVVRTATPSTAVAPPAAPTAEEPREKRPRRGEAAVYVDGKSVGVLRKQEIPAHVASRVINLGEGYTTIRYSLADYVAKLGVDPKKIRAAHLYGGSRISVVDQAEFARIGNEIMFSFSQGDRGKPRIHFPPKKLFVNTTIDMLSGIAFYVDKVPPTLKDGELYMPDGTMATAKVPYADAEQGNGTRVYVDGSLVATVKRKKLTNDFAIENPTGPTKFSLLGYASTLGVDTKKAKAIDLVAGDDVVAHLAPASAKSVTFYVPSRNRGQALVDVPVAAGGPKPARISAVQIFVKTNPPSRPIIAIDEATEATPSAAVGRGADDSE